MRNKHDEHEDRVFSLDEFRQFDRLNENTNSRIPIFFCVDTSGSMNTSVGIAKTRIDLLTDVMKSLLYGIKQHPILSERAVVGIVTYNYNAILHQPATDIGILDIEEVVSFSTVGQTIFSLGLRRTLQAIDQYRDGLMISDVETFKPIMVFLTDGQPVGDDEGEIAEVYQNIWNRINRNDLCVFPIGISSEASMKYIYALTPNNQGYQMIHADDFEQVFEEIGKLVSNKPALAVEEDTEVSPKASVRESTLDTGSGKSASSDEIKAFISTHV